MIGPAPQSARRTIVVACVVLTLVAAVLVGIGYRNATVDPVIRRVSLMLPDWPKGAAPVTAVLISDVHVVGPDMPPERVRRIVVRINALRPDIVFVTGDFVSNRFVATRHYDDWPSIAPLAGLRPRYATVAVLGNHDHERGVADIRRALKRAKVVMLKDDARRIGPIVVGGVDDPVTQSEDFELTLARMRLLGRGPRIMLAHGPALFPFLPRDVRLMLAGHTHCGQVRFAGWLRAVQHCGIERRGGQTLITSAGLGASFLPIRFDVPPDIWVLTLGP